jgi:hypothetical protein
MLVTVPEASLAKQSAELAKEGLALIAEGIQFGDSKYAALQKKSDALQRQVERLPAADRKIYEQEFNRLMR